MCRRIPNKKSRANATRASAVWIVVRSAAGVGGVTTARVGVMKDGEARRVKQLDALALAKIAAAADGV